MNTLGKSTSTFADFGSIATFNAAYTSSNLPAINHFLAMRLKTYLTVSIFTRVPIAEAESVGFIASSLENSSATSTVLTVYQFGISAQSAKWVLFIVCLGIDCTFFD